MVDLEVLIDHPFGLRREALHRGRVDAVAQLAVTGQESTAVGPDVARRDGRARGLAHQTELDGEPEESGQPLHDAGEDLDALFLVRDAACAHRGPRGTAAEADQ